MRVEKQNVFFVLTAVALMLIWREDHKLAKESLRVTLTKEKEYRDTDLSRRRTLSGKQ